MGTVSIQIDESTLTLLRHHARAAGLSDDEFLRLAVLAYQPAPPRDLPEDPWTPLRVHSVYLTQRTNGQFVRATNRLTVTTGPLAGTTYGNPTAASAAVVRTLNPARKTEHNDGWNFWKVDGTGEPLDTVRIRRRRRGGDTAGTDGA